MIRDDAPLPVSRHELTSCSINQLLNRPRTLPNSEVFASLNSELESGTPTPCVSHHHFLQVVCFQLLLLRRLLPHLLPALCFTWCQWRLPRRRLPPCRPLRRCAESAGQHRGTTSQKQQKKEKDKRRVSNSKRPEEKVKAEEMRCGDAFTAAVPAEVHTCPITDTREGRRHNREVTVRIFAIHQFH